MRIIVDASSRALVATFCLFVLRGSLSAVEVEPPSVTGVTPTPGFVNELTFISVTFDQEVTGVQPIDFLVNGIPASGVSGSGAQYTFHIAQPAYGPVDVAWGALHTIMSLGTPPVRFDAGAPGSTWAYELINPAGPAITNTAPAPGITLRRLGQVEVSFNRPVSGVEAADLHLNGTSALTVIGVGAGPYRFTFPDAGAGSATLEWATDHGIFTEDEIPIAFAGSSWGYTVNPNQPAPDVVINEIVAENQSGPLDEEGDVEDWLELHNRGTQAVNLGGWSLSVDREEEGQWVFPSTTIPPGGYLLVWASGKDRRAPGAGQHYHTNFKLNVNGDTLRLFGPELPRTLVDQLEYPEQSPDHAYGRQLENGQSTWRFFSKATPGAENTVSTVTGKVDEVHFSVERGFFNAPFTLTLACRTEGAQIRYTLNGSPPSPTNGVIYATGIPITTNRVVRAAAFAPKQLPSGVRTHTYLMGLRDNRRLLPVLSLVTASNNLYGRTGIMESNPRNTTKHGAAWERPVSVEWIEPEDNGGFQVDAGIRVAGGDYIRGRYNYRQSTPPEGKYSFRLYFRGDYGAGRLNYQVFPGSTLESFNTLHLRAGMNDHSNPLIKDEFIRALSLDVGVAACHGTFVYLFLNGVYKGIYNPCERVDDDFLKAYHGGGELWDVMGPNNQAIRGDTIAWSQLRTAARKDLTIQSNYLEVSSRMDLTNFVDYLLPLIWADNDDWPHNNTRAAREKVPGAKFRFYPWDAEFAFTAHQPNYDTIARTLSSLNPPWGTTDYQAMFNSLKKTAEFKLLFADRVHRAFYNEGPLTDDQLRARYNSIKSQVVGSIPGFNDVVGNWITQRRRHLTNILNRAGFLSSSNAPVPSQLGGRVPEGYPLTLKNLSGAIYYTTDSTDPRVPFTGARSESAREYRAAISIREPTRLVARSLDGTNWSARIDLNFEVTHVGTAVRITEIMYNPPGGDPFEYLELQNLGALAADLSGCSFDGIDFRFPTPFRSLAPGERIILANNSRPEEFQLRYPGISIAGWYDGALNNSGERITLLNIAGGTITSVEYSDQAPWPTAADGSGSSLESVVALGDPNDPSNWVAGRPGGSPSVVNPTPAPAPVRINELQAGSDEDWLELHNSTSAAVPLAGWSITDDSNPRRFVFPNGITIPAGGFLRIECDSDASGSGILAPFQLARSGETIALYDPGTNRVAALRYGWVVDGYTIGLVDDRVVLCQPTPRAPNLAAELGALSKVKINEFLANPEAGDDWLELHNTGELPVALQGSLIVTSNAMASIAAPNFIAAGGFVSFAADENPDPDHLGLRLPASGGVIRFLSSSGEELDSVIYGAQSTAITTGRLPDGSGPFQQLHFSPTRGASNYLAELGTRLRIAEFMAASTQGPDWIEIENRSSDPISLAGYTLGIDNPDEPVARWPLAATGQLGAGQRMLLYCGGPSPIGATQILSTIVPKSLRDAGSVLTLSDPFDRIIDRVEFGLQIAGSSVGRVNQDWVLLGSPTPGAVNSAPAALDSGDRVRLNEWFAGGDGTNDFVEVFNPAILPVNLSGWTLTDDPSISGATNDPLPQLTFIDAQGFARFATDGQADGGPDSLPFQLDSLGETVRLLNPARVIIDSIDFYVQAAGVSEGRFPDGNQHIVRFPGSASPGASNYFKFTDADRDGIDDDWERLHQLNPNDADDAEVDSDKDGLSNTDEFLAGTDPQDSASVLHVNVSAIEAGLPTIHFIAGEGKAYRVEHTDEFPASTWRLLLELPASHAREVLVTDPAPARARPTRYYRVSILP